MADTSIINLITEAAVAKLVTDLQTALDPTDPTLAAVVRYGKLQDDPTQGTGINVLAHVGDPYDEGWFHSVTAAKELTSYAVPSYEIGGGEMWWRRLTIQLSMFYISREVDRDTAMEYSYVVLSRAEKSLSELVVGDLVDTFGERAIKLFVVRSRLREGGGPGAHIYKGFLGFQVLTSKGYP